MDEFSTVESKKCQDEFLFHINLVSGSAIRKTSPEVLDITVSIHTIHELLMFFELPVL
jgi:hypothetical protein